VGMLTDASAISALVARRGDDHGADTAA
jgi:hypothetical protein